MTRLIGDHCQTSSPKNASRLFSMKPTWACATESDSTPPRLFDENEWHVDILHAANPKTNSPTAVARGACPKSCSSNPDRGNSRSAAKTPAKRKQGVLEITSSRVLPGVLLSAGWLRPRHQRQDAREHSGPANWERLARVLWTAVFLGTSGSAIRDARVAVDTPRSRRCRNLWRLG